jgi:hypothetical protein
MNYSALEKHKEALREVDQRKKVYQRLIDKGSMSRSDADRKIAIMQEIAAEYKKLAEMEQLI